MISLGSNFESLSIFSPELVNEDFAPFSMTSTWLLRDDYSTDLWSSAALKNNRENDAMTGTLPDYVNKNMGTVEPACKVHRRKIFSDVRSTRTRT